MNSVILILDTEALAIKARRLLKSGGISSRITSVTDSRDGCKKGLIIDKANFGEAARILRQSSVDYTLP